MEDLWDGQFTHRALTISQKQVFAAVACLVCWVQILQTKGALSVGRSASVPTIPLTPSNSCLVQKFTASIALRESSRIASCAKKCIWYWSAREMGASQRWVNSSWTCSLSTRKLFWRKRTILKISLYWTEETLSLESVPKKSARVLQSHVTICSENFTVQCASKAYASSVMTGFMRDWHAMKTLSGSLETKTFKFVRNVLPRSKGHR